MKQLKNEDLIEMNESPEVIDHRSIEMESKIYNVTAKDDGVTWGNVIKNHYFII